MYVIKRDGVKEAVCLTYEKLIAQCLIPRFLRLLLIKSLCDYADYVNKNLLYLLKSNLS